MKLRVCIVYTFDFPQFILYKLRKINRKEDLTPTGLFFTKRLKKCEIFVFSNGSMVLRWWQSITSVFSDQAFSSWGAISSASSYTVSSSHLEQENNQATCTGVFCTTCPLNELCCILIYFGVRGYPWIEGEKWFLHL